jgi:hypothetical protein
VAHLKSYRAHAATLYQHPSFSPPLLLCFIAPLPSTFHSLALHVSSLPRVRFPCMTLEDAPARRLLSLRCERRAVARNRALVVCSQCSAAMAEPVVRTAEARPRFRPARSRVWRRENCPTAEHPLTEIEFDVYSSCRKLSPSAPERRKVQHRRQGACDCRPRVWQVPGAARLSGPCRHLLLLKGRRGFRGDLSTQDGKGAHETARRRPAISLPLTTVASSSEL